LTWMHPRFSKLFVHPKTLKPLTFFGDIEDNRWTNGFLYAYGEHEMHPVVDGIPIFVLPPEQTWGWEPAVKLEVEKGIEERWNAAKTMLQEKSKLNDFAERMAESEGLILDVASGPRGGFVPRILHRNPEAAILMNELGHVVLQGWQRFLRSKAVPNTCFALFDAKRMPLQSNSIDIVGDVGGFDNILGGAEAVKEAYRVLKTGGTLFSYNSMADEEDFLKLPEDVRKKWYDANPPVFDGFLEVFKGAGFKVINHTLCVQRELSPDEGDLPKEAYKYGVRLHSKEYCTEAIK